MRRERKEKEKGNGKHKDGVRDQQSESGPAEKLAEQPRRLVRQLPR